ncbi:SRPBCC domain-containing protein [Staphylococcus massiliensis]|uniref:Activator of Hsp90 ATPase homologue 1/2-like C-terminal domain-containing protein n=1 Tax=Staphylococcus massiliensis S46 TaxID=1229783 RepID=K9AQ92_9STAP|nr:SRPBCC domain-containing protein [Staphylococcus massiliensis]EKU48196.1 hypothetical protein C273_05802 [Staphylococcus massiliensis S46]MCG3402053.1 SRPBCC domain-containing protein [Staphylococcus massiliensis]MCG3412696.1 SRPBCC domain-containing protein [Staphylococcus massiliensis]POA01009.1 hypothetical protein CD133_03150 [Staphylococcus massiliensis CCUG 55927]
MENITAMKINKDVETVFQSIVQPERIKNFWFSNSSDLWEEGKTVELTYEEYDAKVEIEVKEMIYYEYINYVWEGRNVFMEFKQDGDGTLLTVRETGFEIDSPTAVQEMIGNKEGWVYMLSCLKAYLEGDLNLRAALR